MLQILQNKKGQTMAFVAVALTSLMGFAALAVDVGVLYMNKSKLVTMADAAALGGVRSLPGNPSDAMSKANYLAGLNGLKTTGEIPDNLNMTVSKTTRTNDTLNVTVTRSADTFFARALGLNSANISATASAQITPVGAATGIVPFGVVWQNFVYGQSYILKQPGGGGDTGNYQALALGGTGADVYRGNITNGYNGWMKIDDWISTETGNMNGPTRQGVDARISQDTTATINTVSSTSPRIIVIPVLKSLDVNGRGEVQIGGFAAFFLEGATGNGQVTGRFMKMVVPKATGSETATDYGALVAKLIK